MTARRVHLVGHVPASSCSQPAHMESQGEQDSAQEQVLFKAIAAPAMVNQLILKRCEIEAHGLAQQRREILKRYRGRMPGMDGLQRRERWRALAVVANPLKIRVEVDIGLYKRMRHSV